MPPLSWSTTVTFALPLAAGFGVKVRVPAASTAGGAVKRPGLSVVTVKLSVCADSFAGPADIAASRASRPPEA